MTRIIAVSPENWVSETDEKSKHFTEEVLPLIHSLEAYQSKSNIRLLYNAYYNLDAIVLLLYSKAFLIISSKDNDGKDDVSERTERSKCKTLASLLECMHTKKLSAVNTEFHKRLEMCNHSSYVWM